MKAAIYARVSTLDQEPENQLAELRRYAGARGWETLLLLAKGITPKRVGSGKRVSTRHELAEIDLHWHDLRHEALSRLADEGVPVHELRLLAGHASITTTQRYMNARPTSLAESMRRARERRIKRLELADETTVQAG
jgi:site-specific recombinase XerD